MKYILKNNFPLKSNRNYCQDHDCYLFLHFYKSKETRIWSNYCWNRMFDALMYRKNNYIISYETNRPVKGNMCDILPKTPFVC